MTEQPFTVPDNPFAAAPPFIDRLVTAVGQMTGGVRSTGEDVTDDEIRTTVRELLGDREALAEEVQAEIDRSLPGNYGNETWKGILSTLDYLFGPQPELCVGCGHPVAEGMHGPGWCV